MRSWGCLNQLIPMIGLFVRRQTNVTFIRNVLRTTWRLCTFTAAHMYTQMLNFVIVLSLFPIQGIPLINAWWLLSLTLKPNTPIQSRWAIQYITVPLSDHIQPHPLSPLHTPLPFRLISSHQWVKSVGYHCDEDVRGPMWEASARKSPAEGVSNDLHAARGRAAVSGQRSVGAFHLGQPEGGKEKPFTCDLNRPKNGHQCKETRSSTPLGLVWFPHIQRDQPHSQLRSKKNQGCQATLTNLNQAHTEHPVKEIWKKKKVVEVHWWKIACTC